MRVYMAQRGRSGRKRAYFNWSKHPTAMQRAAELLEGGMNMAEAGGVLAREFRGLSPGRAHKYLRRYFREGGDHQAALEIWMQSRRTGEVRSGQMRDVWAERSAAERSAQSEAMRAAKKPGSGSDASRRWWRGKGTRERQAIVGERMRRSGLSNAQIQARKSRGLGGYRESVRVWERERLPLIMERARRARSPDEYVTIDSMAEVVGRLPPLQRAVIAETYGLTDGLGKEPKEVAELLGRPVKSVVRAHRKGLERLQRDGSVYDFLDHGSGR